MRKLNLLLTLTLIVSLLLGWAATPHSGLPSRRGEGKQALAAASLPGTPGQAPLSCGLTEWQEGPSLPGPLDSAAGAVVGNRLYSLGGVDARGFVTSTNIYYDPITGTWTLAAPLLTARAGAAAGTYSGTIFLAGGLTGTQILTAFEAYTPTLNIWGSKPPMVLSDGTEFPIGQGMAAFKGYEFYMLGGYVPNSSASSNTYIYKARPDLNYWQFGLAMPDGVSGAAAAELNGSIYVVGGRHASSDSNAVFVYSNTQWSTVAPAPFSGERKYPGLSVYAGKLLLTGGFDGGSDSYATDTYLYDPATDSWAAGPALRHARAAHVQGTLGDRVVVAGGYNPQTTASVEYLYLPSALTPGPTCTPGLTTTATAAATATPGLTTTATAAATATPGLTTTATLPAASSTPTASPTSRATVTISATATVSATATPCTISFLDVPPSYIFYNEIQYLACHQILSGYFDGSFRPNANTTRGQLAKIAVNAFGIPAYTPPNPTFSDVTSNNIFYTFIEAAAHAGVINGFSPAQCVDPGTPAPSQPCFRSNQSVTRGQVAKIVKRARNYPDYTPATASFADVSPSNTFYLEIETLYQRGVVSGASCGTGLCYRPNDNVRRGELAKVVKNALDRLAGKKKGAACAVPVCRSLQAG